ncbi:MAG: hypothetical protein F6K56_26070 [Moorea sp. SIO3G5]|nr:hypothetical protein [Moorena sp. SIO3G5]
MRTLLEVRSAVSRQLILFKSTSTVRFPHEELNSPRVAPQVAWSQAFG